jgi:hypothetical protein
VSVTVTRSRFVIYLVLVFVATWIVFSLGKKFHWGWLNEAVLLTLTVLCVHWGLYFHEGWRGLGQWPDPHGRYYEQWMTLSGDHEDYYEWLARRMGNRETLGHLGSEKQGNQCHREKADEAEVRSMSRNIKLLILLVGVLALAPFLDLKWIAALLLLAVLCVNLQLRAIAIELSEIEL